ncbi:MAG: glucan ABC transporter ATP-binding protein/ permease [Rhizobiales bacterium]|nr:glucan ABC transporter ATP-binding protein/ permease [Hyphomicrobiales bacterium]
MTGPEATSPEQPSSSSLRSLLALYRRVLGLLAPEKRLAWLLVAGNLLVVGAQFAEPILFGRVIDTLTGAATGDSQIWVRLSSLIAAWVVFGLLTIVFGTLVALHSDRLAHRQRQAQVAHFFEHVIELPLAYHSTTHSGRLMKIMLQGTDSLWGLWVAFFRDHLSTYLSLIVLLPLSLYLNWRLALLLIALCVVFSILTAITVAKTEKLQSSVESRYSDVAERASDTLGNIALVQSFTRVDTEVSDLKRLVERLLAAQIPVLSWWAVAAMLSRAATTFTILSIIAVGTWLHLRGLATVGEIVAFMSFATMVIHRLEQAVGFTHRILLEAPRLRDFFAVLDTNPAVADRPGAVDPGRMIGEVVFDDVGFSYDGKRIAAEHLSFTVKPGETIALVGPTGAGKSTALGLLHRAFDPQQGAIRIDGRDIRDIKLAALRGNIGVVFQESLLFNRSIADNLRVGKANATDAEMRDAARRAQALDFIEATPGGFDANVGERGRSLSGGERQRLSIARALLKNPPILILDEATSAMDAATEAKVQAALNEVVIGRTTFVIAHRLATIRNADRVMMFDHGRIIESGTFDELIEKGGRFAELARAQFLAPALAPTGEAVAQDY